MSQPHQNGAEALNVLLRQSIEALGQGGPHLEQPAAELRELVSRPPRVAVIGRLKSGKSTLVNALTESRIAATGSLECTMAVSVYDEGAPARAEIIGLDGKVQSVPLAGEPLADLGRPLDEIDFVRQFIPDCAFGHARHHRHPGYSDAHRRKRGAHTAHAYRRLPGHQTSLLLGRLRGLLV